MLLGLKLIYNRVTKRVSYHEGILGNNQYFLSFFLVHININICLTS